MVSIYNARETGNRRATSADAAKMKTIGRIIDRLMFPLNVAAGMEARGFDPGAPKTVVSAESARLYREIVADLRRTFKSWDLVPRGRLAS